MTQQEQKVQAVLTLVKKYPGQAGRGYWKRLNLTESRRPYVNRWLRLLEARGLVRHVNQFIDGHLYARRWYPAGVNDGEN